MEVKSGLILVAVTPLRTKDAEAKKGGIRTILRRDCWISVRIDGTRTVVVFFCFEVLRPSQPNGIMSSTVSLPNNTFTGQA